MIPELFSDEIAEITFSHGVFRLDLASLSAEARDLDGNPARELRQRVVMPLEGFLRSLAMMQSMVEKLVAAGVVKPIDSAQTPPPKTKPTSPNF